MMSRLYALGLAVLFACFTFSSCSSGKRIIPVSKRSLTEVLEGLNTKVKDYDFFSAKAKIKYNGEESKVGGRSTIRMIRDSLIWMNFKKLSVEGARTLIRPDSCWILYRFDNIFESGLTQEFLDYYKIYLAFGDLQNLLVGNFFIPTADKVAQFRVADYYHIIFNLNQDRYEYLVKEDYSIFRILIRDSVGREIFATFSEYEEDQIATHKEIEMRIPDEGLSKISIKLTNIEFDVPKAITFEIPSHYTRIP